MSGRLRTRTHREQDELNVLANRIEKTHTHTDGSSYILRLLLCACVCVVFGVCVCVCVVFGVCWGGGGGGRCVFSSQESTIKNQPPPTRRISAATGVLQTRAICHARHKTHRHRLPETRRNELRSIWRTAAWTILTTE